MKDFYATSEFWAAVIPAVTGILAATGVLTPDKASELTKNVLAIVGPIITLIASLTYAGNRTQLKMAVLEAATEGESENGTVTIKGLATDRIKELGI